MEYRKVEELWELQEELETISKSISRQGFNGAIKKLKGRTDVRKTKGRISTGGKLRSKTYLSRYYLVPLGGYHYLKIARDKDGSLSMWLYDLKNPDKLGISTLLAFEHHPIIAQKLKLLIRYSSRYSQCSKNEVKKQLEILALEKTS